MSRYSAEKLTAARKARNQILIENVRPAFEDFQSGMSKLRDGKARAREATTTTLGGHGLAVVTDRPNTVGVMAALTVMLRMAELLDRAARILAKTEPEDTTEADTGNDSSTGV